MKQFLKILLFFCWPVILPAQSAVHGGEISLADVNLANQSIELDGNWAFTWHEYVNPATLEASRGETRFVPFTEKWSSIPGLRFNGAAQGFASYSLTLKSDSTLENMAFFVPEVYSSYRLFFNGKEIAANGNPASGFTNTTPYWLPRLARVQVKKGENSLVMHVANYHHHKGGPTDPIQLGSFEHLSYLSNFSKSSSLFIAGALLIAGIFAFTVFYFQREDYSFLFFALFVFFYTYRIVGTDSYLLHELFPSLRWAVAIRLEYLSLYASVISFSYFYRYLIKTRVPGWVFHVVAVVSGLGIISLILPVTYFTALIDYFLVFLLVATVVITAFYLAHFRVRHTMAWVTGLSVGSLFFVMFMKSGAHFGLTSNYYYLSFIGYVFFVFFQAVALSQRFGYNLRREVVKTEQAKVSQRHFLNSVSHELKTPMNAILGMVDMLKETDLNKDQEKKIGTIQDNSEHLNSLLHDLLNFSAIEAGDVKLKYRKFNVFALIEETLDRLERDYASKNIILIRSIDDSIPQSLVGDTDKLKLIIRHLIDNAYKYSEKGKIRFAVTATGSDPHQLNLKFSIKDSGKGISTVEIDRVKEAFYQGDRGNTRRYLGIGLGLTLSARLIELMGGDLYIDSEIGQGTTLEFDLNLRKPNEDFGKAKASLTEDLGRLDPKLKILYAEDNPINQKLLTMMLKSMGYEVDIAQNGLEAWEMALTQQYNIIFMDVQMPKMDGIEATQRIIKDIKSRPIIIAVTANADVADQKRCMDAGMNDFIAKPFNAKMLKEGLIKWQGLRRYLDTDDSDDVLRLIS